MKRTLLIAASALAVLAAPAAPQDGRTLVSGWVGLFMDPGTVRDHESRRDWDFGTSDVFGATVQRDFGGLIAGLELGYSPIRHEVRDLDTGEVLADGRARLLTTMAVGRLGGAGGRGWGTYLTGGIGAMMYGIPSEDRWDPDLALRGGGGLEYTVSDRTTLFLQWNRWWVFHQTEGVDDNTIHHSRAEIGARFGI